MRFITYPHDDRFRMLDFHHSSFGSPRTERRSKPCMVLLHAHPLRPERIVHRFDVNYLCKGSLSRELHWFCCTQIPCSSQRETFMILSKLIVFYSITPAAPNKWEKETLSSTGMPAMYTNPQLLRFLLPAQPLLLPATNLHGWTNSRFSDVEFAFTDLTRCGCVNSSPNLMLNQLLGIGRGLVERRF